MNFVHISGNTPSILREMEAFPKIDGISMLIF